MLHIVLICLRICSFVSQYFAMSQYPLQIDSAMDVCKYCEDVTKWLEIVAKKSGT